MKGNVKIELFNKDGSLKKTYENHNMMTNFFNEFILPIWATKQLSGGSNENKAGAGNDAHRFFGTLQLFGDTLSEDPNDFMAGGQKVVGISRWKLGYSGTSTLYGSYNATESGWSDDRKTMKYVYDFPTTQANGTIKSLGLGTVYSGEAGFGVDSVDSSVRYTDYGAMINSNITTGSARDNTCNCYTRTTTPFIDYYFDYENNMFACCDFNVLGKTSNNSYIGKTSKIPIMLKKFPMSKMMLGYYTGIGENLTYQVLDTKTITLKNTLNASSANYGFSNYCEGKLYFCYTNSASWSANTSLIITCLDTDTWEESYITVTNTTGKTIVLEACNKFRGNYINPFCKTFCTGQYLLVMDSTDYCMYTIDLSDNTNVKQVLMESGSAYKGNEDLRFIGYANGVAYHTKASSADSDNTCYCYGVHIPTAKGKHFGLNGNMFFVGSYVSQAPVKNHPMLVAGWNNAVSTSETHVFRHWCLMGVTLLTKMNLEEPVVKTSDLSMKVTYSVTFED